MKAYKATDKNMQCREFQFELNKEFIHADEIELCRNGFHFCKKLIDVFKYYEFHSYNKFFEVEIPDDAEVIHGLDKSVTNKIKFTRELSSEDIKELTNGNNYIDVDGGYVLFGNRYYYKDDHLHRADGPAIVYADGNQEWWQNGKRHRVGSPAVICSGGHQEWWQNGLCHRVDGPAIVWPNGYQAWYQNGKRHRVDGPAMVYHDGTQEFWINGVHINESL